MAGQQDSRQADVEEALKLAAEVEKWNAQRCDVAASGAGAKLAALVKRILAREHSDMAARSEV